MQPVAAGVMSFFTRCFFWIAYNTNTWRALFRPLTHTSISEGQAVALHSNFLAYSGQQMKPLWVRFYILLYQQAWLCSPTATATSSEIPDATTKDLGRRPSTTLSIVHGTAAR